MRAKEPKGHAKEPKEQVMANCIKCGKEISSQDEKVYGVIEKYHYDDRHDTAAMDTGPTTYTPVALIRIGLCNNCNKTTGNAVAKDGLKYILGGIALFLVTGLLTKLMDSDSVGLIGLLGIVMFVYGLVKVIKIGFGKATGKGDNTVDAINGRLKPEWILYPHTDTEIKVEPIPGNLSNRHHFDYLYINEKTLREPVTGNGKEKTKKRAIDTLRSWAKENRAFD